MRDPTSQVRNCKTRQVVPSSMTAYPHKGAAQTAYSTGFAASVAVSSQNSVNSVERCIRRVGSSGLFGHAGCPTWHRSLTGVYPAGQGSGVPLCTDAD